VGTEAGTERRHELHGLVPTFVFGVLAALVVVGVWSLRTSPVGASLSATARAIGSEFGRTGPAALLVLVATAANVWAGALLVRVLRGAPYRSYLDAALYGFAGAVVLDTFLLCVLGSIGLFNGPVLVATTGLGAALSRNLWRPFLDVSPDGRRPVTPAFWVLAVVAWSGPVILQLASPVVPFFDVLHNHIAPVEFVRTYEWFPNLFTSPAPETGPSRQILGFVGLLATTSKLTGLPAVLAAAAFALPLTLLVALATYRFAGALLGRDAGLWALTVMPLTFVFTRLPDSRGTDVAIPLVLASFLPLPELEERRRVAVKAVALAAAMYVHPLLGLLAMAVHVLLALWLAVRGSEVDRVSVEAVPVALLLSFPELIVMAGRDAPSWIAVGAIPLALAGVILAARVRLPLREIAIGVLVAAVLTFVFTAVDTSPRIWSAVADEAKRYPLLTVALLLFVAIDRTRFGRACVLVPVALGVVGYVAATYVPAGSVFWKGSADEVTGKTMQYWIPTFLAIAAGGLLAWAWRSSTVGKVLVAGFLAAAMLPLQGGTIPLEDNHERRVSEILSIDAWKAGRGAWSGWPDARKVLDVRQEEFIDVFRKEQAAGRMTRHTRTLHVANSRWTWVSTPVAAFAGVYETNFSEAPDVSGHTHGGRLHSYADLPSFLDGTYGYVLLEPDRVPAGIRDRIVDAGYRTIHRNTRGEIFRREG
jgi:hypothetical protein